MTGRSPKARPGTRPYLPVTQTRRTRLANHDHRRAPASTTAHHDDGPRRTIGRDSAIQRDWTNPRKPALRTSHVPDPPTVSLRPHATGRQVDKHRGTPHYRSG